MKPKPGSLYGEERRCEACNQPFMAWRNGRQRFCSQECSATYRDKYCHGKVALSCLHCGEPYEVYASGLHRKFCGRKCAYAHRSGENSVFWRTGKKLTYHGYTLVHKPGHPAARTDGYVLLHHLVMEDALGRYLRPGEIVHHINEDRTDNRITNLKLTTRAEHITKLHPRERGPDGRFY